MPEVGPDAERHEEARAPRRQLAHGRHVEMVVVVVRDEHGVDRRQVGERDRRRMEALRPDRNGRHALGEDQIGRRRSPSTSTYTLAWPIQKARRPLAGRCGERRQSTASTGSGAGGTRTSSPEELANYVADGCRQSWSASRAAR
jgi:hypothetical protein